MADENTALNDLGQKMRDYVSSGLRMNNVRVEDVSKVNGVYAANLYFAKRKNEQWKNIGKVGHIFYDPKTNEISHCPSTAKEIRRNIRDLVNL